jgi:NAD(P)H-hydrate epimerase
MKLINVEKMKALESAANEGGYSYETMMLKAGQNLAQVVHERYFEKGINRVMGLVGGGNNGGDTIIALTALQKLGWTCSAFMLKEDPQWQTLIIELHANGGRVVDRARFEEELSHTQLVLDGVMGTGFKMPMREPFIDFMKKFNKLSQGKIIVAVDCPSGVDCVTGDACAETLHADLTVSMEAVKEGVLKFPAYEFCGEIVTVDLGIPAKTLKGFDSGDAVIDADMVKALLPKRSNSSHKGTFGHLLVCGGSVNYPGAPMLAAKSAYRTGAGLVECAIPERVYVAAVANNVESIFTLLEDQDGVIAENAAAVLIPKLTNMDCLLIGPGIGREDTTQRFIKRLLFGMNGKNKSTGVGFVPGAVDLKAKEIEKFPTLVIDADALCLLADIDLWYEKLPSKAVLTPHPGEMSALTGLTIDEIQKDRLEVARRFAQQWGQVVVLKGALTVVATSDGKAVVLPYANSALAKAGSGDVLAGMIAGMIAQGGSPFEAATAGVWLHARAAEVVVKSQGSESSLLAGDLISAIPAAISELK